MFPISTGSHHLGNPTYTSYKVSTSSSPLREHPRWLVRKPVKVNPGLNITEPYQSIYFYCIGMCFAAYVLCTWRLFKLETEGQIILF